MPNLINKGIGGTMNADHIYYDLTISNNLDSVKAPPVYDRSIEYSLNQKVAYKGGYYNFSIPFVYSAHYGSEPSVLGGAFWNPQLSISPVGLPIWDGTKIYPLDTIINFNATVYQLTQLSPVPTSAYYWGPQYIQGVFIPPVYNPSSLYYANQYATYSGLYYLCILDPAVIQPQPSSSPAGAYYWTSITYDPLLPAWTSQQYNYLDKVNDGLASYQLTNITPIPTNTLYWTPQSLSPLSSVLSYQDTTGSSLPVVFDQNRASAYLKNPSEYFLSVQRFKIDNTSTPLFIPQPILGGSSATNTIYSICIIAYGTSNPTSTTIQWVPEDLTVPAPSTPIQQKDLQNPYYYCYSYEYFINLINNAIATIGLSTSVSISFDASTGLFTIQADVASFRTDIYGFPIGTATTKYQFFMNTALYNLFASFNSVYWGGRGGTLLTNTVAAGTGLDYQILFTTNPGVAPFTYGYNTNVVTNTYVTPNINTVYTTQNYNSLPLWSPIKSIVITASKLNVVSEMVATPVVYQNGVNINAGKQNTDLSPILLEFTSNLIKGTEYKPGIYYEPTGEYRLTDLYSNMRTDALQFQVFWKDSFGNLNPFLLSLGSSATMKLLFRKKSFNSDKL